MKTYIPLDRLKRSRDSGSALYKMHPTDVLGRAGGGRKSTSQRVNKSTSWCLIGRISPICPMLTNVKAPCAILCQKYAPFAAQINHNIS